jgi:hypothetical protein
MERKYTGGRKLHIQMPPNHSLGPIIGLLGVHLLQTLAQHSTVPDGSDEADHVYQAGHAMHTAKALVQSDHLLGVRSRVVALLSIASF